MEPIDTIPLPRDWLGLGKEYFFLRAKGDDMADAIQPGDLLLVERCHQVETGELAVFLLNGEATCRRFFPRGDSWEMRGDNPRSAPILLHGDKSVLGRVKALVRKYQ